MLMDLLIESIKGPTYFIKNLPKNLRLLSCKFITFWHRTIVYQLKKNMKYNVKIHLDLTKKRYNLFKSVSNLVKDVDGIIFCYTDINCYLKI